MGGFRASSSPNYEVYDEHLLENIKCESTFLIKPNNEETDFAWWEHLDSFCVFKQI